jgi:GDPmannose 4,6-dehydratase
MTSRRVVIFGIGGQDGYYMSHLLAAKGFEVTGVLLSENMTSDTVSLLPAAVKLVKGSICDREVLTAVFRENRPDHVYNFAEISFVPYSWHVPSLVAEVNGYAVSLMLDLMVKECLAARFFQAGSSEMFGHCPVCSPQNEDTPFNPDNPYASSKVFATHLVRKYRSQMGVFACEGILYNHESPMGRSEFVTRKITRAAAAIRLGLMDKVELGSIHAVRDWSYAGGIVEAMWRMMNAPVPKEYILSSGRLHSVKDWLEIAFTHVDLDWKQHVIRVGDLVRPPETRPLCGDPSLAKKKLSWRPRMSFSDLVKTMVEDDMVKLGEGTKQSLPDPNNLLARPG